MENQEILLKPGQQIKPFVPNDTVHSLVKSLYNLEIVSIKELNSYDDRNFHVKVSDTSRLPDKEDVCHDGYILKVVNSLDSKATDLIDAQHEMMVYLGRHGIPCPKPVKNIHGKMMSLEELKVQVDDTWLENNDSTQQPTEHYIVRLFTFIPGDILFRVPYTPDLFYQVGEITAKTTLALKEFNHKGLLGVDRIWNLSSVPKLRAFVYAVEDEARRSLAVSVIDTFETSVVPRYGELEFGAIHGDLNEQNILVAADSNKEGKYNVSGIIDFGDIQQNCFIFEIAIAICYMMIQCNSMDVLDVPGHVLAGYNSLRPIPDKEFNVLKDCIGGRLCQSLVMGAYSYSQNPDPYVLTTSKTGWHCLEMLWNCPKDDLLKRWRSIMNTYAKK